MSRLLLPPFRPLIGHQVAAAIGNRGPVACSLVVGDAVATGGTISVDLGSCEILHTFTADGTFTLDASGVLPVAYTITGTGTFNGDGSSGSTTVLNSAAVTVASGSVEIRYNPLAFVADPGITGAIWAIDFANPASYTDAGGGAISAVHDLTATQTDLTQATGTSRPTLTAGAYNGFPCARFDGTADHLFSTAPFMGSAYSGSGVLTVIAVLRAISSQTSYWLSEGNTGSGTPQFAFRRVAANADFFSRISGGGSLISWTGTAGGAFDHTAGLRLLRFEMVNLAAELVLDGGTPEVESSGINVPGVNRMALGGILRTGAIEFPTNFDLCEIRMWDAALSSPDADAQDDFLSAKWGI